MSIYIICIRRIYPTCFHLATTSSFPVGSKETNALKISKKKCNAIDKKKKKKHAKVSRITAHTWHNHLQIISHASFHPKLPS